MNANIKEMEINDYNILQNMKAAFYRLWKMKTIVFLSTIIGVLAALIYTTLAGDELSFYSSATIYSAVYGSISETNSGVSVMNNYSSILGTTRVCERAATEINDPKITTAYLQELISSGKVKISGASASGKYGYRLVLNTVLDSPDYVTIITNEMANACVGEINDLLGQDVVQVFDESKVVLARKGYFTSGGHFFVLTGVDSSGNITVADPGSRKKTGKTFTFNYLINPTQGHVVKFWIISG